MNNLSEFYKYLESLIINPSSLANYRSQIKQYFRSNPNILTYNTKAHETAAILWLTNKNNTSAKAVIGHFYKCLGMHEFWSMFKYKYRRTLIQKERKHARKSIPVEMLFKIINKAPMPYSLIFELMYETGSRISEILNITHDEISFDEDLPCIWIHVLKTNETLSKKGYIMARTGVKLADYLDNHKDRIKLNNGIIFNRGYDMCNIILKKATKKAGYDDLSERISTHWIRHTRANYIYSINKDIMTVKKILGHKSINTTETYISESGETSKEIIKLEMERRDI